MDDLSLALMPLHLSRFCCPDPVLPFGPAAVKRPSRQYFLNFVVVGFVVIVVAAAADGGGGVLLDLTPPPRRFWFSTLLRCSPSSVSLSAWCAGAGSTSTRRAAGRCEPGRLPDNLGFGFVRRPTQGKKRGEGRREEGKERRMEGRKEGKTRNECFFRYVVT